jgi:two-component system, OmpR family, response regulator ResD
MRILLFASDRALLNFLRVKFHAAGYSTVAARNPIALQLRLWLEPPELAVVCAPSPGPKSLEILRVIRRRCKIPILTILGDPHPSSAEAILEAGADDYLITPFRPAELLARADALHQRWSIWNKFLAEGNSPMVLSGVALDCRTLRLALEGRSLRLATPEFILLHSLAANRENLGTRSEVIARLWGEAGTVGDLLLDSTLARLQERMEVDSLLPCCQAQRQLTQAVLPWQLEKWSSQ